MVTLHFALTALLYAGACALYLRQLRKGSERRGRSAFFVLAAAVISHSTFLVADWLASGRPIAVDIYETLSVASLLMSLAFLAFGRRERVRVLGAFITPITMLFFLGAGIGRRVGYVPAGVRSAILPVHVGANLLGIVVFGLAFAVAIAYLIQERLLRRKQLGGVFQRLPPLDVLDSLGFRLVTIAFPLFTLGMVSGTVWAVRLDPGSPVFSAAQTFAFVSWVLLAGVLLLRVAIGWRGRRAALGTMMGFLFAMGALAGYVVRSSGRGPQ
jgi:ABC-type uncharacterized transport system permease subunit